MTALWNEARDLVRQERYADALRNYFRVFNYSRGAQTLALARLSVLPAEIAALADKFPAATQALRDEVRDRAGMILTFVAGTDEILEFVALNRALGEPERILQIYDQLKNMGDRGRATRLQMRNVIGEELIDAGRESELGDALLNHARNILLRIATLETESDLSRPATPTTDAYRAALHASAITDGTRIYGALLATQRDDVATRLAQRLVTFDPRYETWEALVRSALNRKRSDVARRLVDEATSRLGKDAGERLRAMLM